MKKFNVKKGWKFRMEGVALLVALSGMPLYAAESGDKYPSEETEQNESEAKEKKQRVITAKGVVTDEKGEPIVGANVLIKEKGTGQHVQ